MLVARILYPVIALGPGKRIGIWVCGCNRRCKKCANPDLQAFDHNREISVEALAELILDVAEKNEVDGITITGGEPFEQSAEIVLFLKKIIYRIPDILVFSGYTYKQLKERMDAATDELLDMINVLIDGEYIDSENKGSTLRGSENQVIHFLKNIEYDNYLAYLQKGRQFQNFETPEGIVSVGLHYQGFMSEFQENMKQKRVEIN